MRDVGPGDRAKLTEYLDAIRDIERRIQIAEAQSSRELPEMERPAGVPPTYSEHAKLIFDLRALAAKGADVHARSRVLELPKPMVAATYTEDVHFPKWSGGVTPLMFTARVGTLDSAAASGLVHLLGAYKKRPPRLVSLGGVSGKW